ncbi:ABC1 family-domain-containing protein [Blyttiomyces helicus]|uniref:ABC1 family-domain-containing protein n=1 Tax=Blyttiomyces helicus TaxID=388810 RepID=A0A4P9W6M3_9FUNG|nr:ABC1 family-domain-containing protein [Blyttiomyces helicus]|eukprot:RKO88111.1 ABC1 family-domain-containing protein [Blyttiomyces helicus]
MLNAEPDATSRSPPQVAKSVEHLIDMGPAPALPAPPESRARRFADACNLFFRRMYIVSTAISFYISYKFLDWRLAWFKTADKEKEDAVWARAHERNARKIYRALVSLQGLWIKDVLPPEYVERLQTLQDALPSKPLPVTVRTICSELGISSLDEVFASFDEEPLATASIAQVHRARLVDSRGGGNIVVKVQHHNVARKVRQDLTDLKLLVRIIGRLEPDFDFSPIVNEWCGEVPKELDFKIEANNTTTIRDAIDSHNVKGNYSPSDPLYVDCAFATPLADLVTEKVMVMTFVDGYRILDTDALRAEGVDMDEIIKHIIRAYAFQIYVIGFWNSDPHPRAAPHEVIALSKILLSAGNMDYGGLLSGLDELGLQLARDDPKHMMDIIQDDARAELDKEEKEAKLARKEAKLARKTKKEKPAPKRRIIDALPGVIVFFGRVLQLLTGLCMVADSRQSYFTLMKV